MSVPNFNSEILSNIEINFESLNVLNLLLKYKNDFNFKPQVLRHVSHVISTNVNNRSAPKTSEKCDRKQFLPIFLEANQFRCKKKLKLKEIVKIRVPSVVRNILEREVSKKLK